MHRVLAHRQALAALCLALFSFAARAADLEVPLGADSVKGANGDAAVSTLRLEAPDAWRSRVTPLPAGAPTLVEFTPAAGNAFKLILTVMPARTGVPPPSREAVAAGAARAAVKAAERSIEPAPLRLHELAGATVYGSYFFATDREPGSGYAHLTQGMAVVDGVAIGFTVLANGEDASAVAQAALQMLREAHRAP